METTASGITVAILSDFEKDEFIRHAKLLCALLECKSAEVSNYFKLLPN